MFIPNDKPNTIELRYIVESDNLTLFDFDYKFYDETLKPNFEKKFADYFYFREIGFETIGRFKKELQTKLNLIEPYYKQLYETEVKSRDIEFLLNKDLKETFIRTIEGENTGNVSSTDNTVNRGENSSLNIFSDTPRNSIETLDKYMSNATKDTNNSLVQGNTTTNANSINTSRNRETTDFISRGNIGVTSSASLLQEWRNVLINIDMLILEECEELFFGLY